MIIITVYVTREKSWIENVAVHPYILWLVLERESLQVIQRDRLLTPDFLNSSDYPEDIFSLPYGYQTFINNFPKLERPER